jgi:hypothetical protein
MLQLFVACSTNADAANGDVGLQVGAVAVSKQRSGVSRVVNVERVRQLSGF